MAADAAESLDRLRIKARALFERRIRRAREELPVFVESCCRDQHGERLRLAPIHVARIVHVNWCWANNRRALILAPFSSGKSVGLCLPLIAWELGRNPEIRWKVLANDDIGAMQRVTAIQKIIESPEYRRIFPHIARGKPWTGHLFSVERGGDAIDPSVEARGVITQGINRRADRLFLDDVVDQRNSMEKMQRRKILDLLESTWLSRLEPDGKVVGIGTVWHKDDAWHHLMQKPQWCTLIQRVNDACDGIEQEVLNADETYPVDAMAALGAAST